MSQSDAEEDQEVLSNEQDTVIFKVIGCTKEQKYQDILRRVKYSEEDIKVTLSPEPANAFNSKAIAFVCLLDGKWQRIGYVVDEILDEVHDALNKNILSINFSWVKYITEWTRSGPGFLAGVNITKRGIWPYSVRKAASTK